MKHPLYVAFMWHHHQPYYRDPGRDVYVLPWVRMHAVKDYLHMAEVLREHPDIKATFNLVPSLVEQILAYANGEAEDAMSLLGRQSSWTDEEKRLILNFGFSINWHRIAFQFPRYRELIAQQEVVLRQPDTFSDQDYRDLLVWFNLAWTDPNLLEQDERLRRLVEKGRGFTIADFETVIAVHREICARVLPAYRELADRGQVELTTSPYHHPILPLLVNTDHARRATPDLPVPDPPFSALEDVTAQIRMGMAAHSDTLGQTAQGLWPPEHAVSPEVLPFFLSNGVQWFVSDEAVLGGSLGIFFHRDEQEQVWEPRRLYQPYRIRTLHGDIVAVFRDHILSDKIGFTYMHYPPHQAAEDLIVRLQTIYYRLNDPTNPYLVVIALDGENAWEHYEHNGDPFLTELYRRLASHPLLETTTVTEYVDRFGTRAELDRLATGSWINGDLTTWIGDPEHNVAWSLLRDTRRDLVQYQDEHEGNPSWQDALERAWRHLYIAEASDWFWWYSHRNTSDQDMLFDALFRANLAEVYRSLGVTVPPALLRPIVARAPAPVALRPPYFTPPLDAAADPMVHWAQAHTIRARVSTGTMQAAQLPIQTMRLGYDAENIYVRLELGEPVTTRNLVVSFTGPAGAAGDVVLPGGGADGAWLWRYGHRVGSVRLARGRNVVEIAVPLQALRLFPGDTVGVRAGVFEEDALAYAVPADVPYRLQIQIPVESSQDGAH